MKSSELNSIQKNIKKLFDALNTKNISNKKYENFVNQIGKYAEQNNEYEYFETLLFDQIQNLSDK